MIDEALSFFAGLVNEFTVSWCWASECLGFDEAVTLSAGIVCLNCLTNAFPFLSICCVELAFGFVGVDEALVFSLVLSLSCVWMPWYRLGAALARSRLVRS